ncbi:MAG: hypothetical protein WDM77_12560 [Steroidobacteraceae bacterium]
MMTRAAAWPSTPMVSGGVIISGSHVRNSLIFSDVRIDERSFVDSAVILAARGCGTGLHDQARHHR